MAALQVNLLSKEFGGLEHGAVPLVPCNMAIARDVCRQRVRDAATGRRATSDRGGDGARVGMDIRCAHGNGGLPHSPSAILRVGVGVCGSLTSTTVSFHS
jgi:hypothetical protein